METGTGDRGQALLFMEGTVSLNPELTCWLLWPRLAAEVCCHSPLALSITPCVRCCITPQVDVGYGSNHSSHGLSHCPLTPPCHPNLIISDWIKLSDYIEALSENAGNEETLSEAGVLDCDSVQD